MNSTGSFRSLGLADQSDVGLVDRGVDVHLLLHVRGDDEQLGRLELRGQRLPVVDLAVDDDRRRPANGFRCSSSWPREFCKFALGLLHLRFGQGDLRFERHAA